MTRQAEARVQLFDAHQRQVGEIVVERSEEKLLFGKFIPGRAFSELENLFREFEEAVNLQALRKVDELDTAISALGLYLKSPDGSQELPSDDSITCRLLGPALSEVNGR